MATALGFTAGGFMLLAVFGTLYQGSFFPIFAMISMAIALSLVLSFLVPLVTGVHFSFDIESKL